MKQEKAAFVANMQQMLLFPQAAGSESNKKRRMRGKKRNQRAGRLQPRTSSAPSISKMLFGQSLSAMKSAYAAS